MNLRHTLSLFSLVFAAALPAAAQPGPPMALARSAVREARGGAIAPDDDRADQLYERARDAIEQGKYDRAVGDLDRVIEMKSPRTDAALYWKAYSLGKLGRKADALSALGDLEQKFKDSRWLRDAKALEVEVRQSSGQTVSPESQSDEDLKLMALRGLMQNDSERAMPIIEQMLAGANSPKVKDRALFVLSQSSSQKARDIIGNVAKGGSNPDLQLRAIHYLGIMGGESSRQILADVYKASNDVAVKRSIIRSFMVSGDRRALRERILGRRQEADPAGDVRRRQRRQADGAGEDGKGSDAAPHRRPQPGADGIFQDGRRDQGDLPVRYVSRDQEGSDQRAVPPEQRPHPRRARPRRERSGDEEGNGLEDVDHG
jgi:hypothetical protein